MLFSYSTFHVRKKKINVTITNVTFQLVWALSFPRMAGGKKKGRMKITASTHRISRDWGQSPEYLLLCQYWPPNWARVNYRLVKRIFSGVLREKCWAIHSFPTHKGCGAGWAQTLSVDSKDAKTVYKRNVFIEAKNKERNRHMTDPKKWCLNPCISSHLAIDNMVKTQNTINIFWEAG